MQVWHSTSYLSHMCDYDDEKSLSLFSHTLVFISVALWFLRGWTFEAVRMDLHLRPLSENSPKDLKTNDTSGRRFCQYEIANRQSLRLEDRGKQHYDQSALWSLLEKPLIGSCLQKGRC